MGSSGSSHFSVTEDVAQLSAERRSLLGKFYKTWADADALMQKYTQMKTASPEMTDKGILKKAATKLKRLDKAMVKAYGSGSGKLQFESKSESFIYRAVLSRCAKAFEDLHQFSVEAAYAERNLEFDTCEDGDATSSRLCIAHYYNRLIILYRHHLNLPHHATFWYQQAIDKEVDGKQLFPWPNEWQIGVDYWQGLRGQPYWEGDDKPPLGDFLEDHYSVIKTEFLTLRDSPHFAKHWPQDNYYLTREGDWSKLDIFLGGEWGPPCNAMPQTCQLLDRRPEVISMPRGLQPAPLPNGVALFRLRPGSRLKPHTGPANYRLYCHLGLVVPQGPWLQVGPGAPRAWSEGQALCFDDSYVHEAWHNGTEDRFVMMVSFWHPDLV